MVDEDFARLIIAAIGQGRDYIIIDKKVLDNSMELVLCDVFGLMGLSTEKAWGQCGADYKGRKDRPWNFVNVVQLPDGSWKVPIGNVRL